MLSAMLLFAGGALAARIPLAVNDVVASPNSTASFLNATSNLTTASDITNASSSNVTDAHAYDAVFVQVSIAGAHPASPYGCRALPTSPAALTVNVQSHALM